MTDPDLAVSYVRLADLSARSGHSQDAGQWVSKAVEIRRQLSGNEPGRLDLAEELAYALYLSATGVPGHGNNASARQEVRNLLEPFDRLGYMTPRTSALLAWAREAG